MIKDYAHKKAAKWVYKLFVDEIKEVDSIFEGGNKKAPPMPISQPKYGGLAIWAQSLIVRIDKAKEVSTPSLPAPLEDSAEEFRGAGVGSHSKSRRVT